MAKALRFLVVDDFSTMRRIVVNLLKEAGYTQVEEAEDGMVALEKLRDGKFDFVVSDVHMPRLDGLQLLAKVKGDVSLCHIPFLMLSADARKEEILQAARLGAAGYVVKPFTKAILEGKVERILRKLGLQ
ncbi:MAG: response regulator [Rhodoferax sp.]|nr:response regulator [Rhodoferax sp.]